MGHPFDVRCCKVNIFFSFAHHVSCFFFLFFRCHTPHFTIWHIFPTDNSRMASSCLTPSILLLPTINPPASHNQSYSLSPSILLSPTINPIASHHHSSGLPAYSLSFIIWLSFIMCRYLSCRHPHPGDYLFSDICPTQHESPVCQYGPGIRQWAGNQDIIHSGRHRACIMPRQCFFPRLSHRYWMGSSSSANDVLIQYRWAPHSVSFA